MENRKLESDQLDQLYTALAQAQLEMENAKKDKTNPFFKSKYADLESVVIVSRPFLAKNGICIIQRIIQETTGSFLFTRMAHKSGQWIEEFMAINPPKNDIQSIGSYITYLKRYCYSAITGVVTTDEDDDGEEAMKDTRKNGNGNGSNIANIMQVNGKISKEQLALLNQELDKEEELLEIILKGYKITKLADIEAKNFEGTMKRIKEVKAERPF